MAFSTQKEFFHVPFFDETPEFECVDRCLKLKSYSSTIDDRSWAAGDAVQSKFLSDLVTCYTPVTGDGTGTSDDGGKGERGRGRQINKAKSGVGSSGSGFSSSVASVRSGSSSRVGGQRLSSPSLAGGLAPGDSLLELANENLAKLERLLQDKDNQLEASRECLRNSKEENEKIKQILNQSFDCSAIKDLKNIIKQLTSKGCLEKCEEKELCNILSKLENMGKHIEVIKGENHFLKRLVQKLQCRIGLDDMKIENESCNDVAQLQEKVNRLQKELCLLRKYETESLKGKCFDNQQDDYVNSVRAIVQERDELRQKCERLKEMEGKLHQFQQIAKEYECKTGSLTQSLDNQGKYICDMENQMKQMSDFYENQLSKEKCSGHDLKCQIDELKCELEKIRCASDDTECLKNEIACLRNEIMKRDIAISDYECQYKQLMYKIKIFKSYGYRMPSDNELNNALEYDNPSQECCCCCQDG